MRKKVAFIAVILTAIIVIMGVTYQNNKYYERKNLLITDFSLKETSAKINNDDLKIRIKFTYSNEYKPVENPKGYEESYIIVVEDSSLGLNEEFVFTGEPLLIELNINYTDLGNKEKENFTYILTKGKYYFNFVVKAGSDREDIGVLEKKVNF